MPFKKLKEKKKLKKCSQYDVGRWLCNDTKEKKMGREKTSTNTTEKIYLSLYKLLNLNTEFC